MGARARFAGAVSQFQTRVGRCLSVEIGAVIVCDQGNRVPVVHVLLRSRWPPDGEQSERAVSAPVAHPEKSLSSKHAVRYFSSGNGDAGKDLHLNPARPNARQRHSIGETCCVEGIGASRFGI
jgi:hypothetical protein